MTCRSWRPEALAEAGLSANVYESISLSQPGRCEATAYMAEKNDGIAGPVAVPDDGTVRAGASLDYVD